MKVTPFACLIILSITCIGFFYGTLLLSPNQYLFGAENDGLKNYYTYAYHIKNDSSYIEFEGMNYPYGEHFLYTDCQPILANGLKLLGETWPFFIRHSIGVLNLFMVLGIFACVLVLYFLLKELGIRPWFRVIFALLITLLAPQLFRMEGHYGLSYSVAIPLSWLLFLYCKKDGARWWPLGLLFLSHLFWLFIHAYLGVITIFFIMTLITINWFWKNGQEKNWRSYLKICMPVLLPLLLFFVFAKTTDHHVGRTENVGGFFLYNAEPDDIFLPHHGPVRILLDKTLGEGVINQKWEGRAYVGLPTTLLFATLIIWFFVGFFRKKQDPFLKHLFSSRKINIAFVASTLVLLFSFGIPFVQYPPLLDHFSILKQFRSTGRFAWPFYFCSLTLAAFIFQEIYRKMKERQQQSFAIFFLLIISGIYASEGLAHHMVVSKKISRFPNTFNKNLLPNKYHDLLGHFHVKDFQAILPLPFYHYGSESYWRPRQAPAVEASTLLSYHSGLPIIGAALTRTSIPESKNLVQLMSPDFYDKPIQQDLHPDLPVLVVKVNLPLTIYEQNILAKSKIIHTAENVSIYSLYPEDLFRNSASSYFEKFAKKRDQLTEIQGFLVDKPEAFLYYKDYEDQPSPVAFRGKGAYQWMKKGRNVIETFPPGTFANDQVYQLSIWMHNGEQDALNHFFRLFIEEHIPGNPNPIRTTIFPEQAETIYGDWSLVEGTFQVKDPQHTVVIATKGNSLSKAHLFADDLLIREAGNPVYRMDTTKNVLFYNNHEIHFLK